MRLLYKNQGAIKPVVPFEPITTDKAPTGEQWIAQVKWDGVRVLTYYDGSICRLFNRRLNERTLQYPELVEIERYCSASSVILDGEIIALKHGKPSFHTVMKRDSIRQPGKVAPACKETPIVYMIFDILFYNGKWVTDQTLTQRSEILSEIISLQEDVQIVESFENAEMLYDVIVSQEMEGVVYKDLTSTYSINGKDRRWQKQKNYGDLVAVIGGVTLRGSVVNALLMGLYSQEGGLWYIGHVGTGKLTAAEWGYLTELIQPLIINQSPFTNIPERIKSALWVKPVITVKVQFIEWTEGHTLRQPSIQAIVDIPGEQCVFEQ